MSGRLNQALATVAFLASCAALRGAKGADDARRPDRFAIVFNMGYANDRLPQDPPSFEKLVVAIKRAHFNTILCRHEPWRASICAKHDVEIFADLLVPEHHVYKNVDGARALCERLRKSDVVYAYHLWSDNIGNTYPGRSRDVKNVQAWDPTHAAYVGTYGMSRINRVKGLVLFGYYDFHWKRGGHWANLSKASRVARGKNAFFLRYCDAAPGRIGAGNPNRVGYTIATSIPFGLKGYLFHYGGGVVDTKTWQLDTLGKDLQRVNAKFLAIREQLMSLGNPIAVYSTPITTTAKGRPTGTAPAVPAGLAAIPAGHWFRVKASEVLFGHFRDQAGRDVFVFAGHNAYQAQRVTLDFPHPVKALHVFDRPHRTWRSLAATAGTVSFTVEAGAAELIRILR
jgi:hypothetical protein